jgi:hypothetical protein
VRVTRRALLETTAALAAIGLSQSWLSVTARRYQVALAAPTRRKLALLIGVNQYPATVCDSDSDCFAGRGSGNSPLQGCLTDVSLQQELLIHRYGFSAADIVTLTDGAATREAIETAFLSHLVDQARSGDVVVVHFSGFGSQVKLMGDDGLGTFRSLVPVDGLLPTPTRPQLNDIMLDTLGLLLRSLKTDRVVTVLDTSYTAPDSVLQGLLRVRSRPNVPVGQLAEAERSLQEELLSRGKITPEQLRRQTIERQFPGIVLSAASNRQPAIEGQWAGFSSGVFTYALTQQLWSSSAASTLRMSLNRISGTVEQVVGVRQRPLLSGTRSSDDQKLLTYFTSPNLPRGADGVVQSVSSDRKSCQIWLAGLSIPALEYIGVHSRLVAEMAISSVASSEEASQKASPTDSELAEETDNSGAAEPSPLVLQVRSRSGLIATARPGSGLSLETIQPGTPVYELVRVMPRQVGLAVAIDPSLERVERVDATSAFSTIASVSSVVSEGQPADCLFGKTQPVSQAVAASLPVEEPAEGPPILSQSDVAATVNNLPPAKTSYGLFYLGRTAIPNTTADEEEAVKTAVNRLTPRLRTLLSTKLIRLTESAGSSRLGVRATLELVTPQERIVAQQETVRAPWTAPEGRLAALLSSGGLTELPLGAQQQYRLLNYSDRPVYFTMFGLDSNGNAIALYPEDSSPRDGSSMPASSANSAVIQPGDIVTVPNPSLSSEWVVRGVTGPAETHLIFSRSPFTKTTSLLAGSMPSRSSASRISIVSNPLKIAQAILNDLDRGSDQQSDRAAEVNSDYYSLDVNQWATLSFVYGVVNR